jgi:hypothetical protein
VGQRLVLVLICVLVAGFVPTEPRPALSAAASTRIAAAVNGNLILFRADGSGRRVLTTSGRDGSPVTSPDGQTVAFLRWQAGWHPGAFRAARHTVMLARPAGTGYAISRFSARSPLTAPGRAVLAWEPGSHAPGLAWFEAGKVAWQRENGPVHWALSAGPPPSEDRTSRIAWSPNGAQIATATSLGQPAGSLPTTLRVAIGSPTGQRQRIVVARFRQGVLSAPTNPTRGSFPVGDGLTFTADGQHLLFATVAKGEGYQLTGIFRVPAAGGVARRILGMAKGVRGFAPFGPQLEGATQFQLSPNGSYLATDPNNRFWIGGQGAHASTVAVPRGRSCVVSQWTWLPDSSGLAYVTACTVAGSSPIRYRLTLGTVPRAGGSAHILYTLDTANQAAIDLAPIYRCTACGG